MVGSLAAKLSFLRRARAGGVAAETGLLIALVGATLIGAMVVLNKDIDALLFDLAPKLSQLR